MVTIIKWDRMEERNPIQGAANYMVYGFWLTMNKSLFLQSHDSVYVGINDLHLESIIRYSIVNQWRFDILNLLAFSKSTRFKCYEICEIQW